MSSGLTHRVIVKNPEGLHLRPADQLVRMAGRYQSTILIGKLFPGGPDTEPGSSSDLTSLGSSHPSTDSSFGSPDSSGILPGAFGELLDCKSILSIMTLGAADGDILTLTAEGPDAPQAIDDIAKWFDAGFPDPPSDPPPNATLNNADPPIGDPLPNNPS